MGACCCAALLASGAALAQVVLINPVRVEIGARQRAVAVAVSLSATATAPMRLQADLLRWGQDVQGQAVTEPSDDLLVTPPIADLLPGATQVFRVTLRGPRPSPEELAYRLIFENVAEPTLSADGPPGIAIKIRMRYDLPVLLAPAGPVVNALRWKPCIPDAATAKLSASQIATACVRLFNAGNRRVKVQTLILAGEGWQQALSFKDGDNVLVGAEREWRVPLLKGQTGDLHGVHVQTALNETLQAEDGGF